MGKLHLSNRDVENIISWLRYCKDKVTLEYIAEARNENEYETGIEYLEELRYLLMELER